MTGIRLAARAFINVLGSVVIISAFMGSRRWWWVGVLIGLTITFGDIRDRVRASHSSDEQRHSDTGAAVSATGPRSLTLLLLEVGVAIAFFIIVAGGTSHDMGRWWLGVLAGVTVSAKDIYDYVRARRSGGRDDPTP